MSVGIALSVIGTNVVVGGTLLLWSVAEWRPGRPLVFVRWRTAQGEGFTAVRWRAAGMAALSIAVFAGGALVFLSPRLFAFGATAFVIQVLGYAVAAVCLVQAHRTRIGRVP